MKIACIGTGWYPDAPGGLEKYVFGMTHEAVRSGDELDLFLVGSPRAWDARVRAISLADPKASLRKRAMSARRAFGRHFRGPYDVVNIHFAMNVLPLIPFIRHSTRRVMHFHGPWAEESRIEGSGRVSTAVKAALERLVYDRVDHFITLSTAFKDVLTTSYGVDPARVSVIPMGIDTDFFAPASDRAAVRAALGWPADRTIFFTARRLVNRVGVIEFVRAAAIARRTRTDFLVKIAGRGPLMNDIAALVREHGLEECVELLGFVSEETLRSAYQAADVTILPTQSLEGFGTIISESLACGTPVIVTPVGGMPEAVAPLADGLICRSSAPDDIAERMLAVLDTTLVLPNAAACRRYAFETYAWDVVWTQIRKIFST